MKASLVAQMVKCLPEMRETGIQSLGSEDPLEKEMETYSLSHSSTLTWKTAWTEEPSRLESIGLQRVRHDWVRHDWETSLFFFFLIWMKTFFFFCGFFFFNFILFLNIKHCISFAKHQNESATGIQTFILKESFCLNWM